LQESEDGTMKVELTSEAVDGLMRSILMQDYRGIVEDTNRLKKVKDKQTYQLQDIEHNLRYIDAMEVLMEYYVGFDWKERVKDYD
jgi:hypothetical protein